MPGAQGLPEVLLQKPSGLLPHPNLKYQASFTSWLSTACGNERYGTQGHLVLFKILPVVENKSGMFIPYPGSGSATLLTVLRYFFVPHSNMGTG